MESKSEDVEIISERVEELHKKYEEFTPDELQGHLKATEDREEIVTQLNDTFFSKLPILIFHPRNKGDSVVLRNEHGELEEDCVEFDVAKKVKSTLLKRKQKE